MGGVYRWRDTLGRSRGGGGVGEIWEGVNDGERIAEAPTDIAEAPRKRPKKKKKKKKKKNVNYYVGRSRGVGCGDFFGRDGLEFFADGVGRESRGKEAAVQTGDLAVGNFAAGEFELAFDAMANGEALRFVVGGSFDSRLDIGIRNSASAEVARDPEFSLPANLRALPRKLLRVARIVELPVFLHARHDDLREQLV